MPEGLDDVVAPRGALRRRSSYSRIQTAPNSFEPWPSPSSCGARACATLKSASRYSLASSSHGVPIGRQALDAGRHQRDARLAPLGL